MVGARTGWLSALLRFFADRSDGGGRMAGREKIVKQGIREERGGGKTEW